MSTDKTPAQAEAEGIVTADVTWAGLTFTVPTNPDDWPVAAQLAFEDERLASALRALLPAAQWSAYLATSPRNRDMKELLDAISDRLGFRDAGE